MYDANKYQPGKFSKKIPEYKRIDIDPIPGYINTMAFIQSKIKGLDMDQARADIKDMNRERFHNPQVLLFRKDRTTLDSESMYVPLTDYIRQIKDNNEVLAPSGTTYVPKEVMKSVPSIAMNVNKAARSVLKKEAFAALMAKDMERRAIKHQGQINKKLDNNKLSGVVSIKSSSLYCPSFHPSLTSGTRITTSISNMTIERFLIGNRLLKPDSALANIAEICSDQEHVELIWEMVERYNLYIPSVDDMKEIVSANMENYVRNARAVRKVLGFVDLLTERERAAWCYTGSYYFLLENNRDLMMKFYSRIMNFQTIEDYTMEELLEEASTVSDIHVSMIAHVLTDELVGKGTNYKEFPEPLLVRIMSVFRAFNEVMEDYLPLFRAMMSSTHMAPNTVDVKSMLRKVTLMSDTDSVAKWLGIVAHWYSGNYIMDRTNIGVIGITGCLTSMAVDHNLRQFSRNMGVADEDMSTLEMKSEFTWFAMGTLNLTKHYNSLTAIVEGNVFDELQLETKGAHLKSASIPKNVVDDAEALMKENLQIISNGGKISIVKVLARIIKMEDEIRDRIIKGDTEVLKTLSINHPESYSKEDPTMNNSKHYYFWKDVFAGRTGLDVEIPFRACKISLKFTNKSSWKDWLLNYEDQPLAKDIAKFYASYYKGDYPSIVYLPISYTRLHGIPDVIQDMADIDGMIMDITNIYRIILTNLNIVVPSGITVGDRYRQYVEDNS